MSKITSEGSTCRCENHKTHKLLLDQHELKIGTTESMVDDVSNTLSSLNGKLNIFTWVIGILFTVMCVVSSYGVIQLSHFKDSYRIEVSKYYNDINDLKSRIYVIEDRYKQNKVNYIPAQAQPRAPIPSVPLSS